MVVILRWFGENKCMLGLCSISTLISFLMTVYVSFKTRNIQSALRDYRRIEKFNRDGSKYKKVFKAYQESLLDDDVPFRKIRISILNDLRVAENQFRVIFNKKEKKCIKEVISKIEVGNEDVSEEIVNELSKVIAIFSIEKES